MKKKTNRILALLMAVITIVASIDFTGLQVSAATSYVSAKRVVSATTMYKDEELDVKLQITGTPATNVVMPNDVMLVLDKSGSMLNDNRFNAMIESAKEFINLVDFSAHEVGIVDYSSSSAIGTHSLTTNGDALKAYLDQIRCEGGTYTHDAINAAITEFEKNGREDAQPVIILLTDGEAKDYNLAKEAAVRAKEAGIVFYTIALLAPNEDPDASSPNALLKEMATTSLHHHFVLGSVGLIEIYRAIVQEIGIASAYNVQITENIASQFELIPGSYESNIPRPTVNGNQLVWDILELKADTIELGFKVRVKDGVEAGTYNLSESFKITYKDYAGANRTANCANSAIIVKNRPPVISEVSPAEANIAGGEQITIKGDKFLSGATVKLGTTLATDVVVVDENTITATVPAGAQGETTLTVTNPDKQSTTAPFTYWADPEIDSITPDNGAYEGNTSVTIVGKNFVKGLKVYFGDQEATVSGVYPATGKIIVRTPVATAAGTVDVTVENPDGRTATLKDGFTYAEEAKLLLEVEGLSQTSGYLVGGDQIKITGKNFGSEMKVFFGANEAVVSGSSTLSKTVVVPAGEKLGMVDVTVSNGDGDDVVLTNGYEYIPYPAPTITSISPAEGQVDQTQIIYINGTNFRTGLTVTVGGKEVDVLNVYSAERIRVRVPAGDAVGAVDVVLTNDDGTSATVAGGYVYTPAPEAPAPIVTELSATEGERVGGEIIYIHGENFQSGLSVTFGGKEAQVLNVYSAVKLRVKVPTADTAGTVSVTITNPDGKSGTLDNAYTYKPYVPTVTRLNVASGQVDTEVDTYIYGTNFAEGCTVTVGGKACTVVAYTSTRLRVLIPAGDVEGKVDVVVTNPDGESGTLVEGYEYLPLPGDATPEVSFITTSTSVTSTQVTTAKRNAIVYVHGTGFTTDVTKVIFKDSTGTEYEATPLNIYSDVKLRVRIPAGMESGDGTIRLVNNGKTSAEFAFTFQ